MKRRLQINLLKLFLVVVMTGSVVLVTQKNYLPINKEAFLLKQKKNQLLQELKEKEEQHYFYEKILPKFQDYKNMGVFLDPTHNAFKHQLRHILDDYNIVATVRFQDPFYDKIFPGFDISYSPVNIKFVAHDKEIAYKLVNDINNHMSYIIIPLQLNVQKVDDRYHIDYLVLWTKGVTSGDLSNLSDVESPWHFSESSDH